MTASLTTMDEEEEEDISDLLALFRSTEDEEDDSDDNDGGSKKPNMSVSQKIEILGSILTEPSTRYGSKVTSLKERCIYSLARAHCTAASDSPSDQTSVSSFLTDPTCPPLPPERHPHQMRQSRPRRPRHPLPHLPGRHLPLHPLLVHRPDAIYVAPSVQAGIDQMSGVLHCEEGGYNTAHSYFLEAFEQLDQMEDRERAKACLNYMMLCKILDAVVKALKVSSGGGVGEFRHRGFVV